MATTSFSTVNKKHIMMSYAWSGTQNLVYEVAEQLRRENIPVWMDIRNGLDGYLNDGMAEAVENSLAVCFFMTPEYQKSKNCKRELEYADKLEIPVISCRCRADFKPSGWLGLIAAGLVSYDFRDLSDKPVNATMNKLINYIQRSILKIAPTVFPDLDGRTEPVIFRNRSQFCDQQSNSATADASTNVDERQSSLRRQSNSEPTFFPPASNPGSASTKYQSQSSIDNVGNEHTSRFTSMNTLDDPNQMLAPLEGYEKQPLVSLEEAVQPLVGIFEDDINRYVYMAKRNSLRPTDGLTHNESASIHLYSMQWTHSNDSLYVHLNRTLRSVSRLSLVPWYCYLKLFMTALFKLPAQEGTVWRGVKGNLTSQYITNEHVTWYGVSSCTASVNIMENFIGKDGPRTLFTVETTSARNIRLHSHYKEEDEVILFPGTYLRVLSKFSPSKDLTIIQLREEKAPFRFLPHPFETNSENYTFLRYQQPTDSKSQSSKNKPKSLSKRDSSQPNPKRNNYKTNPTSRKRN